MGDRFAFSFCRHFKPEELALATLGVGTLLGLLATGPIFSIVSLKVASATFLYIAVMFVCPRKDGRLEQGVRFLLSYAFVVWFYLAVVTITPALRIKLCDGALLATDEAIFGRTPAVLCGRFATAGLTDVMGLCYMTYLLYLPLAVIHAAVAGNLATRRLSFPLFAAFAVGFTGYLLVPAVGPQRAYPDLFPRALPGGSLFQFVDTVVTRGSSGYDVFPSLHTLITLVLLDHDWHYMRRRFWVLLVPCLGLFISTIYLRYHYATDIIAGFLIFLALRTLRLKSKMGEVSSYQ